MTEEIKIINVAFHRVSPGDGCIVDSFEAKVDGPVSILDPELQANLLDKAVADAESNNN